MVGVMLFASLLSSSLLLMGCDRSPMVPAQPSPRLVLPRLVVLYATCTLNKNYLAPYDQASADLARDDQRVTFTPHLERFARQARVFRRHQSEAGQSGTAFASIFSGTQAGGHGIFRHPTPLSADVELIGETFKRAGWQVVAWLEHGMASGELGYAQGADPVLDYKLQAGDTHLRAVLQRLRDDPTAKALLITNFTVTHGPYQVAPVGAFCANHPDLCAAYRDREAFDRYADFYRRGHAFLSYDFPNTRQRTAMDEGHVQELVDTIELLYRANVAHLDQLFGALVGEIQAAGLWDESVVAMTADHGETLFREGTHFKWTHGHQLAPEVLGVPLMIRAPGVAAGDWETVTRSIDVFPTLAGLAGVPLPESLTKAQSLTDAAWGVNLASAMRGQGDSPRLRAFSHTSLVAEPVLEASRRWSLFHSLYPRIDPELMWVQVRDGDQVFQLRRTAEGEPLATFFDLASDPWTRENRFDPDNSQHRTVLAELRQYHEQLVKAYRQRTGEAGEIDLERQEELLKSLGYVD